MIKQDKEEEGYQSLLLLDEMKEPLLLPPPLKVLEQYKQWHSEESLSRHPDNRTFLLSRIICPGMWTRVNIFCLFLSFLGLDQDYHLHFNFHLLAVTAPQKEDGATLFTTGRMVCS